MLAILSSVPLASVTPLRTASRVILMTLPSSSDTLSARAAPTRSEMAANAPTRELRMP